MYKAAAPQAVIRDSLLLAVRVELEGPVCSHEDSTTASNRCGQRSSRV